MQPGQTITPAPQPGLVPEEAPQQPTAGWGYSVAENPVDAEAADTEALSWTASEFIDHEKTANWFTTLALATAVVVGFTYLITKEILTSAAIVVAAALFGVTAKRKPRTQNYQIDQAGVAIGDKFYPYEVFKSFTVFDEQHFSSIQLTPLKRFALPSTLYFPPENGEQIVKTLGNYLPHEDKSHDPVDRLMHKVHF